MNGECPPRGTQFATYRADQLRTVGTGYVLPPNWNDLIHWNATDALALARMFDSLHNCEEAAARGKVFLLAPASLPDPTYACFQVKNQNAEAVFCGNSTAAAAAFWASISLAEQFQFVVTCESRSVSARMTVQPDEGRFVVKQVWATPPISTLRTVNILGHEAVLCDFFNDYLLVLGPLKTDLRIISACWGGMANLRGKIALLENAQPFPTVRFYNCNGLHRSAPQTGLATLALVGSSVEWVRDLVSRGSVMTPAGTEAVPASSCTGDDGCISLRLPEVTVVLNRLSFARSMWLT